jgi:hypothetical protein
VQKPEKSVIIFKVKTQILDTKMIKFLKYPLVIILVIGIVFPFLGSTPVALAAENAKSAASKMNALNPQAQAVVKVAAPVPVLGSVIAQKQLTILSKQCQGYAKQEYNYVQDASYVNLNQPASCFYLQSVLVAAPSELAVKPLNQTLPEVKVTSWPTVVQAPSLMPVMPAAQPYLPLVGFILSLYAMVLLVKEVRRYRNIFITNFSYKLTLPELQILRC